MSIDYRVNGLIQFKDGGEAAAREFVRAMKALGCPDCSVSGDELEIDCYTTSHTFADTINKAIGAFTETWAQEPTTLDTEWGYDRGEWIVGPKGFNQPAYEIECIDSQIASLQRQRLQLTAEAYWHDMVKS